MHLYSLRGLRSCKVEHVKLSIFDVSKMVFKTYTLHGLKKSNSVKSLRNIIQYENKIIDYGLSTGMLCHRLSVEDCT